MNRTDTYETRFLSSYLDTALWSSTDESTPSGGSPLDENYSQEDFSIDAKAKMRADCLAFLEQSADLLHEAGINAEAAGHNFWLTRNGHGAGFWDLGLPDGLGERLTKASKAFGECTLYVDGGEVNAL